MPKIKSVYWPVLLGLIWAGSTLAEPPAAALLLQSRPDSVTVYPDRAVVTRSVLLKLKAGSSLFKMEDLPVSADRDSVRVFLAPGPARIASFDIKTDYQASDQQERKKIEDELEKLQAEKTRLDDSIKNLAARQKMLESIQARSAADLGKEINQNKISLDTWQTYLDFYFTESEKISSQQREKQKKITLLAEQILRLQRDLSSYKKKIARQNVLLAVESARDTEALLQVSYMVPQVSWRPLYEFRSHDGRTVQFGFRAAIRQSSGEDWQDIDLTLSTARPSAGITAPEIKTQTVSLYLPMALYKEKRERAAAPVAAEESESPLADKFEEQPGNITLNKEITNVSFQINKKSTISSDGSDVTIPVLIDSFSAQTSLTSVPRLDEKAYLGAEIENKKEYPILAGRASVFYGNNYIGSVDLKELAPQEGFRLSLGPDPEIKIKRKKLKELREPKGISNNYQRISYRYKIEIENLKNEDVSLNVQDLIPVADDKEIRVKLLEIVPEVLPEDRDKPGVLTWKLQLLKKQKKSLEFEYYIEYPADRLLQFGER